MMPSGCTSRTRGNAVGVPAVVTNDVLYHAPGRHILHDVLTCIREGCSIEDSAGGAITPPIVI